MSQNELHTKSRTATNTHTHTAPFTCYSKTADCQNEAVGWSIVARAECEQRVGTVLAVAHRWGDVGCVTSVLHEKTGTLKTSSRTQNPPCTRDTSSSTSLKDHRNLPIAIRTLMHRNICNCSGRATLRAPRKTGNITRLTGWAAPGTAAATASLRLQIQSGRVLKPGLSIQSGTTCPRHRPRTVAQ